MTTVPVDEARIIGVWGLAGRTVAVAGGSSGIGAAVVQLAAEDGADVICLARRPSAVPGVRHLPLDLRDARSIRTVADHLSAEKVDVLAVCSGAGSASDPLEVLTVNFLGARALVDSVCDQMDPGGAVVVVSSQADVRHPDDDELLARLLATTDIEAGRALAASEPRIPKLAYPFSKAALRRYTTLRAPELMRRGIRLNCVSPNVTDTPMVESLKRNRPEALEVWMPCIGRLATPMEPANAIVFVASPRASYIAGINLSVDGAAVAAMETGAAERPVPPPPTS